MLAGLLHLLDNVSDCRVVKFLKLQHQHLLPSRQGTLFYHLVMVPFNLYVMMLFGLRPGPVWALMPRLASLPLIE